MFLKGKVEYINKKCNFTFEDQNKTTFILCYTEKYLIIIYINNIYAQSSSSFDVDSTSFVGSGGGIIAEIFPKVDSGSTFSTFFFPDIPFLLSSNLELVSWCTERKLAFPFPPACRMASIRLDLALVCCTKSCLGAFISGSGGL
ncbi:hypothetical protein NQ317_018717, partial [Molorchus minor]